MQDRVLRVGETVLISDTAAGVADHLRGHIGTINRQMTGSSDSFDGTIPGRAKATPVPTFWVDLREPVQRNGVGPLIEAAPIPASALTPLGS